MGASRDANLEWLAAQMDGIDLDPRSSSIKDRLLQLDNFEDVSALSLDLGDPVDLAMVRSGAGELAWLWSHEVARDAYFWYLVALDDGSFKVMLDPRARDGDYKIDSDDEEYDDDEDGAEVPNAR